MNVISVMTSLANVPAAVARPLYEFVFPPSCFVCDGPLRTDEHKVCQSCWIAIQEISQNDALYKKTAARLAAEGKSFS